MFIRLGKHKLDAINSPQTWDLSSEKSVAEVPIIGSKPIIQDIGEKLDTITLSVIFNSEYCNTKESINSLIESQNDFEVLNVITGNGIYYGAYIITKISYSNTRCTEKGDVKSIQVNIELSEYSSIVEDENKGSAILNNNPIAAEPLHQKPILCSDIDKDITTAKLHAEKINTNNLTPGKFAKIKSIAEDIKSKLESANKKIESAKKLYYKAKRTYDAIGNTITQVDYMINAAKINSVSDLLSANTKMKDSFKLLDFAKVEMLPWIGGRYDY